MESLVIGALPMTRSSREEGLPSPVGVSFSVHPGGELRIAFAGGGSGGHIYPALAVAQTALARKDRSIKVLFLVSRDGLERQVVEAHGLPCEQIDAVRLTRREILRVLPGMWSGIRQARAALSRFQPHVVYGTGGFVSFPAVVASWSLGIPSLLHEPNTVPGRANRLLARFSQGVVTHFPGSGVHFSAGVPLYELGTPLRYEYDPALRIPSKVKTLLVLGGSQGAQRLNTVVKDLYPRLAERRDLRIVHITGMKDHDRVATGLARPYENIEILPYTEAMDRVLYRTDLALCRAGALTVSELVEFQIPAIYVPYPNAVGNHQYENARPLKERGASEILEEKDLDPERLLATLDHFLQPGRLEALGSRLGEVRCPGAARRVLGALESLSGEGRRADG